MEHQSVLRYRLLLGLLFLCGTGCINTLVSTSQEFKVTAGPPRNIVQNDLPLTFLWSQSLTNGRPDVELPLACSQDKGVVLSWRPDLTNWQGTVLFDSSGNVLWNHAQDVASAVTLDESAVYVFDPPYLRAYEINSGELVWETGEGIGYRLSAYLVVEGDKLQFIADSLVNTYQKESGQLLNREDIADQDLIIRYNDSNYHSDGSNLYATTINNDQSVLWISEAYAARRYLPQMYQNSLIVQSLGTTNSNTCRVNIIDGQLIWCDRKRLLSNIATHNGIGYAVNIQDELIGFRLTDGINIGKIVFRPEGTHDTKIYYHIASCEDHLLVYLASPEELLWFDFVE